MLNVDSIIVFVIYNVVLLGVLGLMYDLEIIIVVFVVVIVVLMIVIVVFVFILRYKVIIECLY